MNIFFSSIHDVTGADEVTGLYLLEACGGDLEMAIGMHIDGSGNNMLQQHKLVNENRMSDGPGPSTSFAPEYVTTNSNKFVPCHEATLHIPEI